jgi:SAM-dependent methyltransferase
MLRFARIILSDFLGLVRVGGPLLALRWLSMIAINFRSCLRERNLQPADVAMGRGPFSLRFDGARAKLAGDQAISGAREIWVRRVYLGDGFLSIKDGDTVVDLGCNMGNFSMLALGHGPGVRLVAVDADPAMCEKFRHSAAANGWESRVQLFNAFIGGESNTQPHLQDRMRIPTISEQELIDRAGIERINFLKVDIEGSEFELLTRDSKLLAIADQLSIELHTPVGDVPAFLRTLEELGFELGPAKIDPETHIQQARRRTAPR